MAQRVELIINSGLYDRLHWLFVIDVRFTLYRISGGAPVFLVRPKPEARTDSPEINENFGSPATPCLRRIVMSIPAKLPKEAGGRDTGEILGPVAANGNFTRATSLCNKDGL